MGWLNGWNYRKSKIVSGTSAGAQTNYQMNITIYAGIGTDTTTAMYLNNLGSFTNFQDVRFTDSTGITLINYWLNPNTLVAGTSVSAWIQIPSIPASPSTTTIYLYYNNGSASNASSGTNTFNFYDDFESGNYNLWTKSITGVRVDARIITEGGQKSLELYSTGGGAGSDCANNIIRLTVTTFSLGSGAYYFNMGASTSNNPPFTGAWFTVSATGITVAEYPSSAYKAGPDQIANNNVSHFFSRVASVDTALGTTSSTNLYVNKLIRIEIDEANTVFNVYTSTNNGSTWTTEITNNSYTPINAAGTIQVGMHSCSNVIDSYRFKDIRAQKYVSPQPTFGASGQSEGIEIIDMRRHYRYRIRLK